MQVQSKNPIVNASKYETCYVHASRVVSVRKDVLLHRVNFEIQESGSGGGYTRRSIVSPRLESTFIRKPR